MSDCIHDNRTADCVCNDCGYDFIIYPMTEKVRQQEQDRIIKLLEELNPFGSIDTAFVPELIALIKGENK